jgi:hypothetical protein
MLGPFDGLEHFLFHQFGEYAFQKALRSKLEIRAWRSNAPNEEGRYVVTTRILKQSLRPRVAYTRGKGALERASRAPSVDEMRVSYISKGTVYRSIDVFVRVFAACSGHSHFSPCQNWFLLGVAPKPVLNRD